MIPSTAAYDAMSRPYAAQIERTVREALATGVADPCEGLHSSAELTAMCPIGRRFRAEKARIVQAAEAKRAEEMAEAKKILDRFDELQRFARGYHPERDVDKP